MDGVMQGAGLFAMAGANIGRGSLTTASVGKICSDIAPLIFSFAMLLISTAWLAAQSLLVPFAPQLPLRGFLFYKAPVSKC